MLPREVAKIFLILMGIKCFCTSINFCYAQQLEFSPNQMIFKGDVATKNNSIGSCTNVLLTNMPEGSIILGVNPISCNPQDWHGAIATLHFNIQNRSFPIVCVLRISWPDRDGKGLHSPYKGKNTIIQFDGQTIWSKRTEIPSKNNNDLYAAEHEPIQTTVVLRDTADHTFTFIVSEKTEWEISSIELLIFEYPKNMRGIGYSPYRDCQLPGGDERQQPTIEEVKDDLIRLSHTCNAIRTYSSTGVNGKVPAIAKSLGLKVYAGASIDGEKDDPKKDAEEIDSLIKIANTENIDGVIIGNEYLYRHTIEPDATNYLLSCILKVKKEIRNKNIPITTAECAIEKIEHNKIILDEIDGLLIHLYPFWAGQSIDSSATHVIDYYKRIKNSLDEQYPDKKRFLIVGETGWPSNGEINKQAVPSFENQRRYLREFLKLAGGEKIEYMYFAAFDELWKAPEGLLGPHWGYSYSDRTAKYNFYGVLIPPSLIPEINIDLPMINPFHVETSNTYKINSEWPWYKKSIKITDLSLKWISQYYSSDSVLMALNKLKNREFADEQDFFHSFKSAPKLAGVKTSQNDSSANSIDHSGYSTGERHSQIEKCILKYSRYHYFFPRFMGDYHKITMYECDRCNPASGEMSTKISFSFDGEKRWCGIYWLPMYDFESGENEKINWEDLPGVDIYEKMKIDKSLPVVLTFYARGEEGGEKLQFKVEGVRKGIKPVETEWLTLEKEWKQYIIDLSDMDLSNVVGGFCCVASADKNPRREKIQFNLDDIQYESKNDNTPPSNNLHSSILESDYYLLQFFGDVTSRSTNFFESNYNGGVFSGETRFIFPRLTKLLGSDIPLPEPFFSGVLNSLKEIDWEDRFDYGIGLEWRPLSTINFLEKPLLRWIKQLRFYTLSLNTKFLQYQDSWSWRPKTDFRYGLEYYKESNLYDRDLWWSEIWADASWRKTNFYVTDYNSWTFAMVPKVGIKLFRDEEVCVMPYITGEIDVTQRYEFWQNRALAGFGIRLMPFRWNETMMNVFAKGLRIYAEYLWVVNYFDDKAPPTIPDYDFRIGINYTINWW
jgi:exo-beta-1,3-glucanase (GH17 family)